MDKKYFVKGMVCNNCAGAIENKLNKHPNIKKALVDYENRSLVLDFHFSNEVALNEINKLVRSMGYEVYESKEKKSAAVVITGIVALIAILLIGRNLGFSISPQISENMSFAMLFIAGVLTSFHCIAMCGGIALSQSIGDSNKENASRYGAIKYNLGRVVSYTLLGGIIGSIGSVISVSGTFRGLVSIFAGLFMILLSLNLMGILKIKLPKVRIQKTKVKSPLSGPFLVGLANGFMPCGPLQTMQLYALGTGSAIGGMSAMFFFSLGTVPLMLGLGLFTHVLSKNGGKRFIQASSLVILVLGMIMVNRGLLIGGYGLSTTNIESSIETTPASEKTVEATVDHETTAKAYEVVDGVQVVSLSIYPDRYVLSSPLVVGMPARIELDIQGINRCNSPVLIPKAGIEVDLLRNEPVMEFTPQELGDLKITCWMGMITTNASIVESISNEL